jgi:hypothetical protein
MGMEGKRVLRGALFMLAGFVQIYLATNALPHIWP